MVVVIVAVAGAVRVAGGTLMTSGDVLRVGLVQGDIDQSIKYDQAHSAEIMDRYIGLSRQVIGAGAQLVIWPEASTPFYFDVDAARAAPIRRLAQESRIPFIIGSDEFEPGGGRGPDRFYNSAVLVGSDGRSHAVYRKLRLVPFGEHVPLKRVLFFVGPLVEAVSDFSFGTDPVVFDADGRRVSVAICYESIYRGSRGHSSSAAVSCSRRSRTTRLVLAGRRPRFSTGGRARFAVEERALRSCAPPTQASAAPSIPTAGRWSRPVSSSRRPSPLTYASTLIVRSTVIWETWPPGWARPSRPPCCSWHGAGPRLAPDDRHRIDRITDDTRRTSPCLQRARRTGGRPAEGALTKPA
jgi:hypothetical protein